MKKPAISDKRLAISYSLIAVFSLFAIRSSLSFASVKQEVYVTGTVESFGGYSFTEALGLAIDKPGRQEVGVITVEGVYNGEYPWIMRIYTDNFHFTGIGGAVRPANPAGLVSRDGRFAIPLQVHGPLDDEGIWRRIPDLSDPDYLPYQPDPELGPVVYTDRVLMGIDPRNGPWVVGPDGLLFTDDDSLLGDFTVRTPCEILIRAEVDATAAPGSYETFLYIETLPAP